MIRHFRSSTALASVLLFSGLAFTSTGCIEESPSPDAQLLADALTGGFGGVADAITNAPADNITANGGSATATAGADSTATSGDQTNTDTDVDPEPVPSALVLPPGAIGRINEDVTGLIWTFSAGTYVNGAYTDGLIDDLPADWQNVISSSCTVTLFDADGNATELPETISNILTVDDSIYDPNQGCVVVSFLLQNLISGELQWLDVPEACR